MPGPGRMSPKGRDRLNNTANLTSCFNIQHESINITITDNFLNFKFKFLNIKRKENYLVRGKQLKICINSKSFY